MTVKTVNEKIATIIEWGQQINNLETASRLFEIEVVEDLLKGEDIASKSESELEYLYETLDANTNKKLKGLKRAYSTRKEFLVQAVTIMRRKVIEAKVKGIIDEGLYGDEEEDILEDDE